MVKIAYLSGTRADLGIMQAVLKKLDRDPNFDLQVYVTGMHLMAEHGSTFKEVKKKFPKLKKINLKFQDDSSCGVAEFVGKCTQLMSLEFKKNPPDFILVQGDRPEMLAIATVGLYLQIPTIHFHGGERSGTVDEPARHAIVRLSSLHLVATKESAIRLLKMGEEPWRIRVVGAPALDTILQKKILSKKETYQWLGLDIKKSYILVTLHPVSSEAEQAEWQMLVVLEAVKHFNLPVVIIYPNADPGSQAMIAQIKKEAKNPLFKIYRSLPFETFLSLEKYASCWVGNSSAGLIESASFKIPVINIGSRQKLRQRTSNVLDSSYHKKDIIKAIKIALLDKKFKNKLTMLKNPWGNGTAAQKVIRVLNKSWDKKKLLNKKIVY